MKKLVSCLLCIISCTCILCACGNSYTAQDLQDAKNRYYSGKFTREDEIMVKGFEKWKADQDKYID